MARVNREHPRDEVCLMEIIWRNVAKFGYEAYSASTDNKNFRGDEMPRFDDLPEEIVNAWIAAARQICDVYGRIST